jgi:hypothetical protein
MKRIIAIAFFLTLLPAAHSQGARPALPLPAQLGRVLAIPPQPAVSHSASYQSAQRKLQTIAENGRLTRSQPQTTVLTTDEINAYLAEGGVALPDGVQRVRFSSVPRVVTAAARIDFDRLTASRKINNPWMAMLFTGVHDVSVEAQASGSNGVGSVRVNSVAIDGLKVPQMALQFLVDYCLKPKYGPNVGLDSHFSLPAHIDIAVVGNDQVAFTQK